MHDVLAFGAHPDDVEIGCGGTVALLAKQGRSVVIVDFTRGETGTRGTTDERAQEAAEAARVLGAAARVNLELPDGLLALSDPEGGRPVPRHDGEKLVDLIREQRPRPLVGSFPGGGHPGRVENWRAGAAAAARGSD